MARLISKRVRVIDCNCSQRSTQASADRFDACTCKVRVERGKRTGHRVDQLPEQYYVGTVFIASHPKRAWGQKSNG